MVSTAALPSSLHCKERSKQTESNPNANQINVQGIDIVTLSHLNEAVKWFERHQSRDLKKAPEQQFEKIRLPSFGVWFLNQDKTTSERLG